MIPVLPLDIVDNIIEILSQDDPKLASVKACSLACHDLLPICRKRIFASVVLWESSDLPPIEKTNAPLFQELLSTTPEIADHIRDVSYQCHISADPKDLTLMQTFHKLTRLRSLRIMAGRSLFPYGNNHIWKENSLRPALLFLLHLPSLTEFSVYGIADFVLTDLAPCANLDYFSAGSLSTDITSPFPSPDTSIGFRKMVAGCLSASMITQMCEMRCTDGKPFIDFDKLEELTFTIRATDDITILRKLFSRCKYLEEVRMKIPVQKLTSLSTLLNPSSQTLTNVYINITGLADDTGSSDLLWAFANDLEHISADNVIEELIIDIYTTFGSGCTRGDEWGRLDKALSQAGWAKLQWMSLRIEVYSRVRQDNVKEELEKLPETQLKWLSSTKSLSFEFEVVERVGDIWALALSLDSLFQ